MIHVATVSGGLTSAYCAELVLRDHPGARLIFTDTKWEDPDLYRFLKDLEKRWGKDIEFVSDGRNPEQLFDSEGILGNDRMPVCSRKLKAGAMQSWLRSNLPAVVYFGIDLSESHRAEKIRDHYERVFGDSVRCDFPLMRAGLFLDKEKIKLEIRDVWGIEIPRLYKMGFDHNNCGGGCVRGKKGHWKRLLEMLPEVFAERERMEKQFRKNIPEMKYTILEGQSLEQFRLGQELQPSLFTIEEDGTSCICFEVEAE